MRSGQVLPDCCWEGAAVRGGVPESMVSFRPTRGVRQGDPISPLCSRLAWRPGKPPVLTSPLGVFWMTEPAVLSCQVGLCSM